MSHIFHRNMASLLCVFACEYSNLICGKRKSHIFYRNMASPECVFAYAYPKLIVPKRRSHTCHRNTASLLCVSLYALLKPRVVQKKRNKFHKYVFSLYYVLPYPLEDRAVLQNISPQCWSAMTPPNYEKKFFLQKNIIYPCRYSHIRFKYDFFENPAHQENTVSKVLNFSGLNICHR